jgi:hypothetical protein
MPLTKSIFAVLIAMFWLAGCTALRTTNPQSSAEQQLLIATAADRAAEALAAQVPVGMTAWVDRSGLSRHEEAYALAAIEDALLRRGVKLMANRDQADAVILPRTGMLSTDERSILFGLPSLPVPLAPGAMMPALSFYSQSQANGSAKFAASVYDAKSGKLIISTDPAYGFSHGESGTVLFFFAWRKNDAGVDFNRSPPRPAGPAK